MHFFSLPCVPMQKLLIWFFLPIVTGSSRQGPSNGSLSQVQWVVCMTWPAASGWHSRQAWVTSCPLSYGPFIRWVWSVCGGRWRHIYPGILRLCEPGSIRKMAPAMTVRMSSKPPTQRNFRVLSLVIILDLPPVGST